MHDLQSGEFSGGWESAVPGNIPGARFIGSPDGANDRFLQNYGTTFQPSGLRITTTTAMPFPVPPFRPPPLAEPVPVVLFVDKAEVQWNRPMFKAPALEVHPRLFDSSVLAEDLRRVGLGER